MAGMISCSIIILLHLEHFCPSVSPFSVHVALVPFITIGVCPSGGMISCAINISPQFGQCCPSVLPDSVQVG